MQIKAHSNVVVFGGSFNPLHEGHLELIRALSAAPFTHRILVIPNRVSPFKAGGEALPDVIRLEILRKSLPGIPKVELSELEMRLPAPSYTYKTLGVISSLLPMANLSLALGMDAFEDFAQWHQAGEILALAGLVVFPREGIPGQKLTPENWQRLLPKPWNSIELSQQKEGLVTNQGRLLIRPFHHAIPGFSSREILQTRNLKGVPAAVREVLTNYWRTEKNREAP